MDFGNDSDFPRPLGRISHGETQMEKNPEEEEDTKLTLGDWRIYPVMVSRSIFEGYPALNMYEGQRVIRGERCRMSFWCSDSLVFQATKSKINCIRWNTAQGFDFVWLLEKIDLSTRRL